MTANRPVDGPASSLGLIQTWGAGILSAALHSTGVGIEAVGIELRGAFPRVIVRIGEDHFALAVEFLGPRPT
ncbi:MAG TPA: hypothetical protein VFD01_16980 [Candidatus Dormibacteraeota bacterium]|nr:hypothetical protein [Candidatus Dormibacteraeota bacterium]